MMLEKSAKKQLIIRKGSKEKSCQVESILPNKT